MTHAEHSDQNTTMSSRGIALDKADGIAWLTLARPEALNALSLTMLDEIDAAISDVQGDGQTRVLVITGQGRAFCAGADLKGVSELLTKEGPAAFLTRVQGVLGHLRALPMPVVAGLNGITMAGGLELAMSADIIVAADTAKIGDGHSTFGMLPGAGGSAVLPRLVGPVLANYLLFTGEAMSAEELLRAGLIAKIYPAATFAADLRALAERIAGRSPLGLRLTKQLARAAETETVEEVLGREVDANISYAASHDIREGMAAFAERRKPRFLGR
jgi:enoyl-CoA hydratase